MFKSGWIISSRFAKINQNEKLYTWMYIISIATISLSVVALLTVSTITQSVHEIVSTKMGGKYPYIEIHDNINLEMVKHKNGGNVAKKSAVIISKNGNDIPVQAFALKIMQKENIEAVKNFTTKLTGNSVLISKELSEKINIKLGDRVLLSTTNTVDLTNINQYLVSVIGFMENNYQAQILMSMNMISEKDSNNWKDIVVVEPIEIIDIQKNIDNIMSLGVGRSSIIVWFDKIPSLYDSMKLEKVAVYTIFSILIIISSFTIFATIASLGIKRKRDVAVLRMLGCRRKQVFIIFILQGVRIFLISSFFGVILSYGVIENIEKIFSFIGDFLSVNIKDIMETETGKIEMFININYTIKILFMNLLISVIASLIPSYIIAKMETGGIIKYG